MHLLSILEYIYCFYFQRSFYCHNETLMLINDDFDLITICNSFLGYAHFGTLR